MAHPTTQRNHSNQHQSPASIQTAAGLFHFHNPPTNRTNMNTTNTDLQTGVRSRANRIPAPRAAAYTAEHQIGWEGAA